MKKVIVVTSVFLGLLSCTSDTDKTHVVETKYSNAQFLTAEIVDGETRSENKRIVQEQRLEDDRISQERMDKYLDHSLPTGATPYAAYYGSNATCSDNGCSQIKVRTSDSDVLVTIKKNDQVVRHAFIQAGSQFTFSFPNGTYQAFFYYGKGWDPQKEMKGGEMLGGFITQEIFGKDDPHALANSMVEYELILQRDGNFSTRPSDAEEAL